MLQVRSVAAFALASILVSPNALTAQQAPAPEAASQGTTFKVTTRIVVLDVVVTDKQGNVIDNLDQSDFTILEDKQPQKILSFEPPARHVIPGSVTINSSAELEKLAPDAPTTILVLDELNTAFSDMSFARGSLKKYLELQPEKLAQPTTLVVATNTRFTVLHDYTQNRAELLTALDKHFPEYPWRLMNSGKGGPGAAERLAMSLGQLEQIANATTGHPGRKNIIWVGKGFPPVSTQDSPDKEAAVILAAVQKVTNMLRDARVTLYTIDPTINNTGTVYVETPEDLALSQATNAGDPFEADVNFSTLAPATGGRAYFSRNDVDAEIGTSIRDGGNYYTLSYSPGNKNDLGQQYRHIEIKTDKPGISATTRNGYYVQNAAEQPAPSSNLKLIAYEIGSAATSTMAYNGLRVTVTPSSTAGSFVVHVESKELKWQDQPNGDRQAEVTMMSASLNKQNKFAARNIQEMTAHVKAAEIAKSLNQSADFVITAQIPAGTARLRFVVRDAVSGHIGTAELDPVTLKPKQ